MVLIDSNVLVCALNSDAPEHALSRRLVEFALSGGFKAVLLPQILVETYAILTGARRVSKPLEPQVAWTQIVALQSGFEILPWHPQGLDILGKIVSSGTRVFDAVLVSQMLAHGLDTLCTNNPEDFQCYSGIRVLAPAQLLFSIGPSRDVLSPMSPRFCAAVGSADGGLPTAEREVTQGGTDPKKSYL